MTERDKNQSTKLLIHSAENQSTRNISCLAHHTQG